MEKVIQLSQEVHAEASAVAWLAVGVLMLAGIILGIMALFWIFGGGLGARGTQELLAEQRQIASWLRDDRS